MSHAFYRTAQGRLPKPMSSKGKTTFSSKKEAQTASFFWFEVACDFTEQKRLEEYLLFLNFEVAYGLL